MYPRNMSQTCCDKYHKVLRNRLFCVDKESLWSRTLLIINTAISRHKCPRVSYVIYYLVVLFHFPIACEGFCPSKCICDDDSLIVQCTNASLDLIPFLLNPQTQSLSLPCNKIEAVGQSLTFYPDLKEIDLSYNHIKAIDPQDFEAQGNLLVLNLNKNRLRLIQNRSLVPLTGLRELYLSNNILSSIEPNSFYGSNELKILDLSNNKFKSLLDTTFGEANELEDLRLSYNYFSEVPSNALSKLQSLKELHLTGNLISELPKSAFQSLANLTSLSLDKNNISVIFPESFTGLNRLKYLSIKDNRLDTLSANLFRPLISLENLDLSGNLFQELRKTAFPDLSSLLHLRLTRCPRLYRIDSEAFVSLKALETLQLSHNARLVYLGESTFSSLEKLTDLDLTACGLIFVHPNQMPRNQETKLHLAGNPLHCNCSLLWLASLPFNDSYYFDAPTCATPPTLYGVPVNRVDLRAAGCDHHLGLAAIGTCVGVVLLGLLIIAVFLAWRWRKRTLSASKALAGNPDRGLREPWGVPTAPPGTMAFQGGPIYVPKYCLPSAISAVSTCGHTQCQEGCTVVTQPPYSLHPVTRPLLTPPSPSPRNHPQLPVDLLYPTPYEEDTHWYTTIGRDGREYLTGELKRDQHSTPPPLPQDSPPPPPALVPSSPSSVHLKRTNSSSGRRHTPMPGPPVPPFVRQGGGPPVQIGERIPITYI